MGAPEMLQAPSSPKVCGAGGKRVAGIRGLQLFCVFPDSSWPDEKLYPTFSQQVDGFTKANIWNQKERVAGRCLPRLSRGRDRRLSSGSSSSRAGERKWSCSSCG